MFKLNHIHAFIHIAVQRNIGSMKSAALSPRQEGAESRSTAEDLRETTRADLAKDWKQCIPITAIQFKKIVSKSRNHPFLYNSGVYKYSVNF